MVNAAVTIVSENYISQAKILCKTFLQQHPDAKFYVFLCDECEQGKYDDELFTLLKVDDICIPDRGLFFTQYDIMEANTAVKPFVLEYLFNEFGHQKIAYIDPDIQMFQPMTDLGVALNEADIVLTPHMRRPTADAFLPNEISILQSGIYNLGFIGLSQSSETHRFLKWWQERLFRDCVVDIPKGLFVDQKWIDLVPSYFENVHILRDPGYNVAYWNLHERDVYFDNGVPFVEGRPITFFHFSGYNPFRPDKLSKHQTRFSLSDLPEVEKLCRDYGDLLLQEGFLETCRTEYSFAKLPNGVEIAPVVRKAVRMLLSNGIDIVDPWEKPNAFVKQLMTIDPAAVGRNFSPLQRVILEIRPDVADTFPEVHSNPADEGFFNWLHVSGADELKLASLLSVQPHILYSGQVAEIFEVLEAQNRSDVFSEFDDLWLSFEGLKRFCGWILRHGIKECGLTASHIEALMSARNGPFRVMMIYLSDRNLQRDFPDLQNTECNEHFCHWLFTNAGRFELSTNMIEFFSAFCRHCPDRLLGVVSLYGLLRQKNGNVLTLMARGGLSSSEESFLSCLLSDKSTSKPEQILNFYESSPLSSYVVEVVEGKGDLMTLISQSQKYQSTTLDDKHMRDGFEFLSAGIEELKKEPDEKKVNIAGFFNAPTGMGSSGRSMLQTISGSCYDYSNFTLPTFLDEGGFGSQPHVLGWPSFRASVSITVANADTVSFVKEYCPASMWGEHNIGYWVWETEKLPEKFKPASEHFETIWTPSEYSAKSIAAVVDIPVHILPHVVDVENFEGISWHRGKFNLPKEVRIFGYFFDPKSAIERKNPFAVVQAFRKAFGDREDVLLVLKVNGREPLNFEYQSFKALIEGYKNVRLMAATLPQSLVYELMACLDVYVSLHRSEGFGLTCAEAMAMGKPVIASGYSGNLEFMDSKSAFLVPATIVETDRVYGAYPQKSRWCDPDLDVAADFMLKLADDENLRQNIGLKAKQKIKTSLSTEVVSKRFESLISEIL